MKQVEQNYRTGKLRVVEVPAPRVGEGSLLVATRVSLISSGTEKQLMDLAKASLAGKAMARPGERPLSADERLLGTAATVTASILGGAHIVRVHDVAEMVRVVRVADQIVNGSTD